MFIFCQVQIFIKFKGGITMNSEDIKKMQEVSARLTKEQSLKWISNNKSIIDSKMEELRQQEKKESDMLLEELSDEEKEEIFMILQ